MKLHETKLLKLHKNEWILDLRFQQQPYVLTGIELIFYRLVKEIYHSNLACSINTDEMKKGDRVNRLLKAPLYQINGLPYISYGFGSGHIGYFMSEFPDYPVEDPHLYSPSDPLIDDNNFLHLSRALKERVERKSYRQNCAYHWRGQVWWLGNDDTDMGLHIFIRRTIPVAEPRLMQGRLF